MQLGKLKSTVAWTFAKVVATDTAKEQISGYQNRYRESRSLSWETDSGKAAINNLRSKALKQRTAHRVSLRH